MPRLDFSGLINAINTVIIANGNREITGPVLNDILQKMSETLYEPLPYDDGGIIYYQGECRIYNGVLYLCTAASTSGTFNPLHWTEALDPGINFNVTTGFIPYCDAPDSLASSFFRQDSNGVYIANGKPLYSYNGNSWINFFDGTGVAIGQGDFDYLYITNNYSQIVTDEFRIGRYTGQAFPQGTDGVLAFLNQSNANKFKLIARSFGTDINWYLPTTQAPLDGVAILGSTVGDLHYSDFYEDSNGLHFFGNSKKVYFKGANGNEVGMYIPDNVTGYNFGIPASIGSGGLWRIDGSGNAFWDNNNYVTQSYIDSIAAGMLVDCGNWDASSGLFPSTGGTGVGGAIKKGNAFYVAIPGTTGGEDFDGGDSIRALVDNPGQISSNWGKLEHNTQQATTSVRGTAKLATTAIIQDEATINNSDIVTPQLFWDGIEYFLSLPWTWDDGQIFSSAPRFNSAGVSQYLKTNATKDLVSVANIPATDVTEDSSHRFITDVERSTWSVNSATNKLFAYYNFI